MAEVFAIPDSGLISLGNLSQLTGINMNTLAQSITDNNIPVLKLGSFKRDWYVNLKKLADIAYD